MKRYFYIVSFLILLFILSCKNSQRVVVSIPSNPEYEQFLADSILQYGLDHEALYTLLADIKPISSLVYFPIPSVSDATINKVMTQGVNPGQDKRLDKLYSVRQAINQLNIPDIKFVIIPSSGAYNDTRLYILMWSG
jgi:hypothetical protein